MIPAKVFQCMAPPFLVGVIVTFAVFNFSSCGGAAEGGAGGAGGGGAATTMTTTMLTTPTAPTVTTPSASPYYSNGNSVTISGGCTTGATVSLSGSSITTQTTTCASSAYSFTVNKSSDATYTFSLIQTVASVDSAPSSLSWIRDTAVSVPTVTSPANPYTSADTTFNVSGACETGATVSLAGDLTGSTVCSGSAYSLSITKNANATYHFTVSQTDLAGNVSGDTAFQWTRDTTVPATPAITSPALTAGTYYSNGNSLTVAISCTSGLTVTLSGSTITTQTGTCASSAFTFGAITKTSDAGYVFSVKQTSAANVDSGTATMTWSRDTVAPSAPTVTGPTGSPYLSAGASITISGGCESDAAVNLAGATTQSATCSASLYGFTAYNPGSNGVYNFTVTQTDRAGNSSAVANYQWTRDTVAPTYSSINPANSAGTLTSPAVVTVSGSGFLSSGTDTGTVVTIGGSTCSRTATAVTDSAIECTPARHLAGAVNVVITKATGLSVTGPGVYTYTYSGTATYASLKTSIFSVYCASCHMGGNQSGGLDLDSYSSATSRTVPFDAASSTLYIRVNNNSMPASGGPLSAAEKQAIADWINQGINP